MSFGSLLRAAVLVGVPGLFAVLSGCGESPFLIRDVQIRMRYKNAEEQLEREENMERLLERTHSELIMEERLKHREGRAPAAEALRRGDSSLSFEESMELTRYVHESERASRQAAAEQRSEAHQDLHTQRKRAEEARRRYASATGRD